MLERLHPGVARLVGAADSREQRIAAAVLAAGPGAMASHRSAAHLWGIPRPDDDPVDVMLTDRRREATLVDPLVHRPRDRKDLSPVLRANIRTSNVLRLLCDLGAVDPRSVPAAVGHVVTTGMASPVALRTAVDVHTRRGRHGVPAFRAALDEWVIDGKPADSVLELTMRALIKFEKDRLRDQKLTAAGYITSRFTYRQLTRQPAAQADRIRGVVRRWASRPDWGVPIGCVAYGC